MFRIAAGDCPAAGGTTCLAAHSCGSRPSSTGTQSRRSKRVWVGGGASGAEIDILHSEGGRHSAQLAGQERQARGAPAPPAPPR
jgi:hypothetical protein